MRVQRGQNAGIEEETRAVSVTRSERSAADRIGAKVDLGPLAMPGRHS